MQACMVQILTFAVKYNIEFTAIFSSAMFIQPHSEIEKGVLLF